MAKKGEMSSAQRREVALMMLRREEPAAVPARRFGISEATLYKGRDDFPAAGEAALGYGRNNGKDGLTQRVNPHFSYVFAVFFRAQALLFILTKVT